MQSPFPPISHAYRLLTQEEKHREVYNANHAVEEPMAFAVNKRRFEDNNNRSNNSTGYNNNNFNRIGRSQGSNNRSSNLFCDHCKISGHTREKYWKINGYPSDNKQNWRNKRVAAVAHEDSFNTATKSQIHVNPSITVDQYNHLLSLIEQQRTSHNDQHDETQHTALIAGMFCLLSVHNGSWIIDSGATNHMCYDLSLLSDYHVFHEPDSFITIPDGSKIQVKHKGTIKFSNNLILKDRCFTCPRFSFQFDFSL